jgi:hypothetical protein
MKPAYERFNVDIGVTLPSDFGSTITSVFERKPDYVIDIGCHRVFPGNGHTDSVAAESLSRPQPESVRPALVGLVKNRRRFRG